MAKSGSVSSRDRRNVGADALDYYPTPPWAVRALIENLPPFCLRGKRILEPAAGNGAIVRVLWGAGARHVAERDIYDYAADKPTPDGNFLSAEDHGKPDWIITNPPYSRFAAFAVRALRYKSEPSVALLGRVQILEGKERAALFAKYPPSRILVFSGRIPFMRGAVVKEAPSTMAHCWLIWRRDNMATFGGETKLSWIGFDAQKRLERAADYEFDDGKRTVKELL